MFDYVIFVPRLPKRHMGDRWRKPESFQSKSVKLWEHPDFSESAYTDGCVTITVHETGGLVGPNGVEMDWTGSMVFYGGSRTFRAEFKDGKMQSVVEAR